MVEKKNNYVREKKDFLEIDKINRELTFKSSFIFKWIKVKTLDD